MKKRRRKRRRKKKTEEEERKKMVLLAFSCMGGPFLGVRVFQMLKNV